MQARDEDSGRPASPLTAAPRPVRGGLLVLALALAAAAGCVPKARYAALADDLEQTRQGLAAERAAAATATDRCARVHAADEQRAATCEQEAAALSQEIARQAEAARVHEREAQELATDLDAERRRLAQLVKDRSQTRASIDEMRRALAGAAERERQAARRVAEFKDMLARFKDLIDAGSLQVRVIDGRMVLTLPMDILFASGSARLSREGRDTLLLVGRGLATLPGRRFQVEGHTDNVPIHTAAYPSNWELASARALVVVRTLLEGGLGPEVLSAGSFAEHHPAATNDDDVSRARNRRIEIVVVPDLTGLPGYDELQRLSAGG